MIRSACGDAYSPRQSAGAGLRPGMAGSWTPALSPPSAARRSRWDQTGSGYRDTPFGAALPTTESPAVSRLGNHPPSSLCESAAGA